MASFATWMHNDGQARDIFEQENPVSDLLGSLCRKGIGASRLALKRRSK